VPDDLRIVARTYDLVPRPTYDQRIGAVDALLMPFDPDGEMLTTGTIGDALAFGLPTIASSWPFLTEALGDAAITYGATEDDLVACLDGLDRGALATAAAAALRRRPLHNWAVIAEQTYGELDRLGSDRH
jgi:glycosyltransferase involved in cell wall biosynthesis